MKQFIKAKSVDDGKVLHINLSHISFIRKTDSGYLLTLLGNKFIVDTSEEIEVICNLLAEQT
jgi:uncharacterized protein YlzI (FlbEa/FlbD family)